MKRVSLENSVTKTNGFFEKFQNNIWNIFIDDCATVKENLRYFYVADRVYSGTFEEIENLLERVGEEIAAIYKQSAKMRETGQINNGLRIGYYELDLIDFLLNVRSNRILNLVGSTGVGKTTFLSYIFHDVRRNTATLRRFVPVIIRLTEYPKETLSEQDLFQVVWQNIRDALQEEISWRDRERVESLQIMLENLKSFGADFKRSLLVELIDHIKGMWHDDFSFLEPVFIFDNVDQLGGESVAKVSTFARALFLEMRVAVIIAMRPPAFATHAENDAHKGSFQNFFIDLKPPSLSLYFSRRMSKILPAKAVVISIEGKSLSIRIPDVRTAASNIARNILTEDNQRLVLEGIANNNIRKAGRAFCNFLRFRDLRLDLLFDVSGIDALHTSPGGISEHLLNGMMLGPNMLYRDRGDSRQIVSNILFFDCPGFAPDYLIQYRILALLNWSHRVIEVDLLLSWLRALGYEKRHVALCIEHMLKRGLIYSPEAEYHSDNARHLAQCSSGEYYLTHLVCHGQYLWHAIPDVPLEHCFLSATDEKQFVGRMRSILEFLNLLAEQEQAQFGCAVNSTHAAAVVGSIEGSRLLQRRIISAAWRILRLSSHSRHESVREAGAELTDELETAEARTQKTERHIAHFLISTNLMEPRMKHKRPHEFRSRWAPRHEVEMRVPAVLSVADPNEVEIECHLAEPNAVHMLFGRLKSVGSEDGFDEMTELHRSDDSGVFRGCFSLAWSGKTPSLPDFSLSLFADSRPILRKVFHVPATV